MELLQKLEVIKMIGVLYQFDQSFCFFIYYDSDYIVV